MSVKIVKFEAAQFPPRVAGKNFMQISWAKAPSSISKAVVDGSKDGGHKDAGI